MNKKILVTMFILVVLLTSGVTYSWLNWTSTNTNVTFNIAGATVTFDAGSAVTGNLIPTSSRTISGNIIKTITVSSTKDMYFSLYLELTKLPTNLKHESFRYALYEGSRELTSGNFSTYNATDVITLQNGSAINTERTLTLYIWIDGANYNNPSTMQNQYFEFKLRADATDESSSLAEYITNLSEISKHEIRTVEHTAIVAASSATGNIIPAVTDYRYYGATPNNYITFNGETWRIIGVFYDELTDSNRVKIIKAESIGNMAWDTGGVRAPNGVNAWTTTETTPSNATLNTYLNGTYYNSLTTTSKNLTSNASWYLGGYNIFSSKALNFYTAERENVTYSTRFPGNDTYTRATYWNGTVGLMYPSDYGYAASDTCVSDTNLSSYNLCTISNWLYNSSFQWTISPYSGLSYDVFYVRSSGLVDSTYANRSDFLIRPVLYLISEAKYVDGDGSSEDPFVIN